MKKYIVALNVKSRHSRAPFGRFGFMARHRRLVWRKEETGDIARLAELLNEAIPFMRKYNGVPWPIIVEAVEEAAPVAEPEAPAEPPQDPTDQPDPADPTDRTHFTTGGVTWETPEEPAPVESPVESPVEPTQPQRRRRLVRKPDSNES